MYIHIRNAKSRQCQWKKICKGYENKHLGRTFVKHWKEGKVGPPSNGKHALQTDTNVV